MALLSHGSPLPCVALGICSDIHRRSVAQDRSDEVARKINKARRRCKVVGPILRRLLNTSEYSTALQNRKDSLEKDNFDASIRCIIDPTLRDMQDRCDLGFLEPHSPLLYLRMLQSVQSS